jgi:hypothetical protein
MIPSTDLAFLSGNSVSLSDFAGETRTGGIGSGVGDGETGGLIGVETGTGKPRFNSLRSVRTFVRLVYQAQKDKNGDFAIVDRGLRLILSGQREFPMAVKIFDFQA